MTAYLSFFDKLDANNHKPTSPKSEFYNCIAWAAGEDQRWWQPDLGYFWPPGAPAGSDVDCLIGAFAAIGYVICGDGLQSPDVQKVALYSKPDKTWTHAARQLPSGKWTSKLGKHEDIEHDTPEAISGETYGSVHCYMARKAA